MFSYEHKQTNNTNICISVPFNIIQVNKRTSPLVKMVKMSGAALNIFFQPNYVTFFNKNTNFQTDALLFLS